MSAGSESVYGAYMPPPTFGPPPTPYEPNGYAAPYRPAPAPHAGDVVPPYARQPEAPRPAVHLPEPPNGRYADSGYPPFPPAPPTPPIPAPVPTPVAATPVPAPAPVPPPPPAPEPTKTTIHGLPIRVPQTSLPAEARAAGANSAPPATPTERDPRRVSATMAAYARGLNSRPGQPGAGGQPAPQYRASGYYGVPTNDSDDDYEQHPYPPMPNTGNY